MRGGFGMRGGSRVDNCGPHHPGNRVDNYGPPKTHEHEHELEHMWIQALSKNMYHDNANEKTDTSNNSRIQVLVQVNERCVGNYGHPKHLKMTASIITGPPKRGTTLIKGPTFITFFRVNHRAIMSHRWSNLTSLYCIRQEINRTW